ncbi:CopG family ribbon-helix-helix protein [Paraglaciecola sp. MB-3u-78]|jgi:predicted transcriptional regulator|uniref:CopG family ribbon-helix-helix protein n=1 Tax=Paraglaciecola sp. MB-3u-78 TaxID=2058332 RepID=UPI000C3470CB|nr:CopG family ribbon-helix-helix protein [Paraglaciecola sp. MB-3u-78]PKG97976.1 CopG family transcriptional regulator [Paraglaciecola sp. MB-3u-78]
MAVSIKLNDELKNKVQKIAENNQRSPHWIMCEAIRDYVERQEKKQIFKQEALASWASYKETGQHLTGEEVNHWLSTWGTDNETLVPACHK